MSASSNDDKSHSKPLFTQIQQGICPSCQRHSRFTFIGIQRWSQEIADAHFNGVRYMKLWCCEQCDSSVTHIIKAD